VAIVDLGTGARRHLTVTGDTVNVAARLLDAARGRGVPVLISAALLDAAGGAPDARPLGQAALRGRRSAVAVFGLAGCAPSAE
jgi:adenylate cyclase